MSKPTIIIAGHLHDVEQLKNFARQQGISVEEAVKLKQQEKCQAAQQPEKSFA